jgi:hypothetical protein
MHLPHLSLKWSLALVGASAVAIGTGCSSSSGPTGGPDYGGVLGNNSSGGTSGGSSGSSSGSSSGGGTTGSSSGGGSGNGSGSSGSSGGSGSSSGGGDGGVTTLETSSLANGQTLAQSVIIAAGATVTIDPGATVNVGPGVTITVEGTLTASSASPTHASLTGASWTGIVVAAGGTLALDGVDITGASTPIDVSGTGEYDDGTITGATEPFAVESSGTLTTKHGTVTGTHGASQIAGSLTASFLDYDNGGNEGIETTAATAQLSVEDSTLHGPGGCSGCDMLIAETGAAKFHVAYTNITGVHCAFHFNTLSEFDVSYTNMDGNAFGFMLYGSGGAGPFTVTYSNLYMNNAYDYSTLGTNSPITFDHDYSVDPTIPGDAVTVTNAETTMVAGTGPR